MASEFYKIIHDHYTPLGFTISKLSCTGHWNVLRLYDRTEDKYYIAKGIMHLEDDDEMGPEQMNTAFFNEVQVLEMLPSWWGLYVKDKFKEGAFRVIVTPEIPNCKWATFKGNSKTIAEKLFKQIEWLHYHGIAHNDLELKNVLLSCDFENAIIIDFEKAILNASDKAKRTDYKKLLNNLKEYEQTRDIALKLEKLAVGKLPINRRFSIGGCRKFRTKTYKKRFVKQN